MSRRFNQTCILIFGLSIFLTSTEESGASPFCDSGLHSVLGFIQPGQASSKNWKLDEFLSAKRNESGTYEITVNREGKEVTFKFYHSKSGCLPTEHLPGRFLLSRPSRIEKGLRDRVAYLTKEEAEIFGDVWKRSKKVLPDPRSFRKQLHETYLRIKDSSCGKKEDSRQSRLCEYTTGSCVLGIENSPDWNCVRNYVIQAEAENSKQELSGFCKKLENKDLVRFCEDSMGGID